VQPENELRGVSEGKLRIAVRHVSSVRDESRDRPASLADYLAILRRRKWIVIVPVTAALVAYVMSTTQSPVYSAKAQVWFDLSNAAATITGTANPAGFDPARFVTTQATIARSPELAKRVAAAATVTGRTSGRIEGELSANPQVDADILELSASASNASDAVSLTNTYADQFTRYKAELDKATIEDTLRSIQTKINKLSAQGATDTARYDALVQKQLDLETEGGLIANNAHVTQPAEGAVKVRPRAKRNAILGGLLGSVLAIGLAFLAEALDRRVRSEQEVEEVLELPLLGRVARPPRRLQSANRLVMLAEPRSAGAATFRRLRTSLEFVNFERAARTIMVTSAVEREGKSTTVANLAVAFARAGRRVALVDLDLRAPFLHLFFGVSGDCGITDVVVDHIGLDRAIRPVPLPAAEGVGELSATSTHRPDTNERGRSNGRSTIKSVVHLLPCGTIPPAPDAFLESERVSAVLERLSQHFDVVLVDAPPLLGVGDVMTLSTKVDAIVVVARLGIDGRHLRELDRQLQSCRATILGLILTGVSDADSYVSDSTPPPTTSSHTRERGAMGRKEPGRLLRKSGRDG
jgi:polysaccharide biosynthesis transport protein